MYYNVITTIGSANIHILQVDLIKRKKGGKNSPCDENT